MESPWFKRLIKELPQISSQIRIKRIKLGFWRIYFKHFYIHEVFEEMPEVGFMFEGYDPRIESQSYYEEYEDNPELIRKIKNYIEGYRDSIKTIKTRIYMLRNNNEFYERSKNAYKQMTVK